MASTPAPPIPNSYWAVPGRLLAGEYPAGRSDEATESRLRRLLEAGIDCFVDLTAPGELPPYERLLPGPYSRGAIAYLRKPIRDHGLPESAAQMTELLDEIDAALADGRRVYLHCRAGIGRTNLVVGCWLARHGPGGPAALAQLNELWSASSRAASWPSVPETEAQCEYVRGWPERRAVPAAAQPEVLPAAPGAPDLRDRLRGMLLGLAAGDALGQATAGRQPGEFAPVGAMLGGGPDGLAPGAWSDETAMALCLAESLAELGAVDAADQVRRYRDWQQAGRWSSTGRCVGISAATARALASAQWSGIPWAGSHDPARADKEPLARIGPAVALLLPNFPAAVEAAVSCARVTHQAPLTLDAVRCLAALLAAALTGASRDELLQPLSGAQAEFWQRLPLKPELRDLLAGSWRERAPPQIHGGGQALQALEAALWAFAQGRGLADCLRAAVNLGGDADTTGAIVGQLAGAHSGAAALPAAWRGALARHDEIVALADRLHDAGGRRGARA